MSLLHRIILGSFVATLAAVSSGTALGQHSDIEYSYGPDQIEVEFGPEGRVFEGDFGLSGPDLQLTSEPGFEGDILSGEIVYNVLGPLQFWNGTSLAPVAPGTQVRIENVPSSGPAAVQDTIISGTSGVQPGVFFDATDLSLTRNRIGEADGSGELHVDLNWTLEPLPGSPATGAYAVEISLSTSEPGIADSESFFIVQNFGLPEAQFEAGVEAFAELIPEPTSLALLSTAVFGLAIRRRKASLQLE